MDETSKLVRYAFDETNHGRFPEVMGIVSDSWDYFDYDLKRHYLSSEQAFLEVEQDEFRDFRYMVVRREHYNAYGYYGLVTRVIPKLIKGFGHSGVKGEILVDGFLKQEQISEIIKSTRMEAKLLHVSCEDFPKKQKQTLFNIALVDGLVRYVFNSIGSSQEKKFSDKQVSLEV